MDNENWNRTGKHGLRIGTWNVRTLYKAGALQSLTKVVEKYNIQILSLQETRWPGEGSVISGNMMFMYRGNENNKHENGVGFLIHKSIMPQIKQFIVVNERICYIRINMKHHDLVIICTYAPTETADEEIKNVFYDSLESTYDSLPNHYVKIIMGDLNAQIVQEEIYKHTIGKHSLHKRSNNNGLKLINFASSRGMSISSAQFPRKNIYKHTWISPGSRYISQIDHVLINNRYKSSITNVKSCRRADVASDHYLVIGVFKSKMTAKWNNEGKSKAARKFDVEKLKEEEIRKKYQEKVDEKLDEKLENFELKSSMSIEGLEDKWSMVKNSIIEAAESVVQCTQRTKRNKWFNECC